MKTSFKRNAVAACLLGLAAAGPVAAAEFSVEGIATEITQTGEKTGTITCNGVKVNITADTQITSPTNALTMSQLALIDRIRGSGSTRNGFVGGTCIIDGQDNFPAGPNVAETIFVEIAENVLVGSATAPRTDLGFNFAILGVQVRRLQDPAGRIVAPLARNQYGFEINLGSVRPGDLSSAEGHLGQENGIPVMYAHTIETTGGRISATAPESLANVAVQRAQFSGANQQWKVEVRGGCTILADNANRLVKVEVPDGVVADSTGATTVRWVQVRHAGATNGFVTCVRDPEATQGRFGAFRLRNDTFRLTGSTGGPLQLRASIVKADGTPAVPDPADPTGKTPLYHLVQPTVTR